ISRLRRRWLGVHRRGSYYTHDDRLRYRGRDFCPGAGEQRRAPKQVRGPDDEATQAIRRFVMKWALQQVWRPRLGCLGGANILVLLLATATCAQESQFLFDPAGNLFLQIAATTSPPQIIGQPQMQVVQPGALVTFSVVALDTSGLSYQWLFNGANLPGQTSDALLLSNVSTNNQGYYSV